MMVRSIRYNSMVLGVFALVTALLLASTNLATRDNIAGAERRSAQASLLAIFPPGSHDNDLLDDTLPVPAQYLATLGLKQQEEIHIARREGDVVGYIIPAVAPDGYSGDIHLQVGVRTDGTLAGVRVTRHAETPGLGDKVETRKSDWIHDFKGKSLGKPPRARWAVARDGGDFDQFTGATITPRAVVNQVRRVLVFVEEYGDRLLVTASGDGAVGTTTGDGSDG